MDWKKLTGKSNLMNQENVKKEALFNEVKGSLFEYLVASFMAKDAGLELEFQRSLDSNYLTVLSQQDRLIRQYYPEMQNFLRECAAVTVKALKSHFSGPISKIQLTGKLSNSPHARSWAEADLIFESHGKNLPVSLKLNKKNSFVNTKSGGVKSYFSNYFPFVPSTIQDSFNKKVDFEFETMAHELHNLFDLQYVHDFKNWVEAGHSELPGEIGPEGRKVLKSYYANLAREMHGIFKRFMLEQPEAMKASLHQIMGFGGSDIIQLVCFHDFKGSAAPRSEVHLSQDLERNLQRLRLLPFAETASVDWEVGDWKLQIRIKPMNKFTTTAMKINCSVKFS
jgi:hypothetical protein